MADPIGIEKTTPPAFNVKSPLDIGKWNAAGDEVPAIRDAKQQALDAQENLVKSLEARYANPNWFKVAAGFAKPQLGGFVASLGSAAEALGENVEAQRAIAPTVERMRAEVAQGRIGMETNKEQARLIKEYDEKGLNDTAKLRYILSLAPNSDVGKSILDRLALETGRRAETGMGLDIQERLMKNPALKIINDPTYKGVETDPAKQQAFVKSVEDSRPAGMTPQEWASMGFTAKTESIISAANEKAKQYLQEGQKASLEAEKSHEVLDDLSALRKLAVDPSLAPLFSVALNGDLFSQFRAFLDKNPGNTQGAVEGLVAATIARLKNPDEATRAKADKLIKNIADLEVKLRGTLNNPTDAASALSIGRSPSLANSQAGFVGIVDQLGLGAYRDIELNSLRNKLRLTANDQIPSDQYRQFRNNIRSLKDEMATKSSLDTTPIWFYPGKEETGAKADTKSTVPTAASAAPAPQASSAPSSAGSTWAQLQKWKQSQAQKP
jgi:hypothetical protein